MSDIDEQDVAEQIDRKITSSDGLLALVLCLSVAAGLLVAGVASVLITLVLV